MPPTRVWRWIDSLGEPQYLEEEPPRHSGEYILATKIWGCFECPVEESEYDCAVCGGKGWYA